uniref:Zinc finger protein 90 n=3 Tax=Schistocephalus solidus TaxID=70667 RepID=A0A0X3NIS1_SCHSO
MTACSSNSPELECYSTTLSSLAGSSESASPNDDFCSEGYLVLTFNKGKDAKVKTAAFADVSELGFCENILCEGEDEEEEDGRLGSTIEGSESTKPSSGMPGSLAGSDCSSSSDSNSSVFNGLAPQGTTGLSRLAAVATAASLGIDISELTSAQKSVKSVSSSSSATSPYAGSHLGEYVRRYRYPDGDTRYDWLSCPLTEMQHRPRAHLATALLPSKDGASGPNLVYDSSLPAASTLTQPRRRPFLLTGMASSSGGLSRKMLRCEECGKYYRNEYSLHHHICLKRKDVWKKGDVPSGLIDGQVIYFCPACNKPFKWLGNLTRHYYVHTGQRFFKCDICQKEFFSAYQVKRHMNSHTGLRFNCEVCDKPFTCKYACAWHMRQHSNSSSLVE